MKQCSHCPWKVDTDPFDIPGGYDPKKHAALRSTIADGSEPFAMRLMQLPMMACHESELGSERPCVGWLANQLGRGNNIVLRIWAMRQPDLRIELDGEQHECFEDTLP